MSVNLFSNKPKFCNKPQSFAEILNLPRFDAAVEANPDTCSWAKCGDPNLGTTFRKNVLHQVIRCGGAPIDFNFMETMFPNIGMANPAVVGSKRWFNHYQCDPNYNIYAQASVTADGPNEEFTFQLLRSNHSSSGTASPLAAGFSIMDVENSIVYTVTDVDTTTPYAHLISVVPNESGITGEIKANKPYLFPPAIQIGGCGCATPINSLSSIGYTQEIRPIRIQRAW